MAVGFRRFSIRIAMLKAKILFVGPCEVRPAGFGRLLELGLFQGGAAGTSVPTGGCSWPYVTCGAARP